MAKLQRQKSQILQNNNQTTSQDIFRKVSEIFILIISCKLLSSTKISIVEIYKSTHMATQKYCLTFFSNCHKGSKRQCSSMLLDLSSEMSSFEVEIWWFLCLQKLQHMKVTHEEELTAMKQKIRQLQEQVAQTPSSVNMQSVPDPSPKNSSYLSTIFSIRNRRK